MLKHLFITAVVLLSLTGCVTSEESIDESTTSSSSSALSSSSSLSSLVSSSSRSSISSSLSSSSSSMISSSSSSILSSSSSTSSNSSSSILSSSSSSSTDTIITSSSSSSSLSSSSLSSLVSSSSSSSMSSSSISSSLSSSSSSTVSSSSSSISSLSSSSSSSISSSSSSVANVYLERVDIPQYDPDNPTHVLITPENGKWNNSVLNNPDYRHFYVTPGVYGGATTSHYDPIYKVITASGTAEDRRTISLHNGNDIHPASLSDGEVADVAFRLTGASYWTIDRMANLDRNTKWSLAMKLSSNHNIINRWHLRNHGYGVTLQSGSSYNTIQNSYINHATDSSRRSHDAIGLQASIDNKGTPSVGNKFINNDIRNATDGIQLTWNYTTSSNFEGTIIDSNRIWFDEDSYVNKEGVQDPNGEYTNAENLMDIKAGSTNADNPVVITNNIMWGLKTSHPVGQDNNQILSSGTAIVVHGSSRNIRFDSNVIFDVQTGINIGQDKNFGRGENIKLINNIFYNINKINPEDFDYMLAIANLSASNLLMEKNTIIKNFTSSSGSGNAIYSKAPSIIKNNLLIDTKNTNNATTSTVDGNWFYNASERFSNDTNSVKYVNSEDAKMKNFTFSYKVFTLAPASKVLPKVLTTTSSPHYNIAGSTISN